MLVSIVVPLFNKAGYLSRALDSIFAQEYHDFEVIVVDDGSTDDGLEVARAHKDKRLRIISQANAGPGAARNRGLAECNGSFVAFLDADDAWMPNFLAGGMRQFEKSPSEIASVTSGYVEMPRRKSSFALSQSRGLTDGRVRLHPGTPPALAGALVAYMTPCTTIARTEVIRTLGGFYENGRCSYGEDAHLWLKLLFNEQVAIDLEPRTLIYRDASDLSGNLPGVRPVEPFLEDPSEVEGSCPANLRPLLRDVLAIRAFKTACVLGYWGDWRAAARLRRRFVSTSWAPLPYRWASLVCATPVGSILGDAWRKLNAA